MEIEQVGGLLVKVLGFVTRGKLLKLSVPVRIVASSEFVPICPKKRTKMRVEFSLQTCKKEALKILGALPDCKLNLRRG